MNRIQPNEEYIKQIIDIVNNNHQGLYCEIKRHKELFDYINEWCSEFNLTLFAEKVFWTINKMTEFPKCENYDTCGHYLTSKQFEHITNGYRRHCSRWCSYHNPLTQERLKATCIAKYGRTDILNSDILKQKIAKTNLEKYGAENPFASEIIKQRIKKYWNDKYGVDNPLQVPYVKELQASHRAESKRKEYETKRKNKSFNKSKPEDEAYEILCDKYGKDDVFRQYNSDSRYPFLCDFYVKSVDLFIECNFHWTHGGHPFDENSENDRKIIETWKERGLTKPFYAVAIHVWTEYDVNKRNIAKQNNIKYVEIWNKKDMKDVINSLR